MYTMGVPKYILINLCELLCGKYTWVSVGLVSVCLLRRIKLSLFLPYCPLLTDVDCLLCKQVIGGKSDVTGASALLVLFTAYMKNCQVLYKERLTVPAPDSLFPVEVHSILSQGWLRWSKGTEPSAQPFPLLFYQNQFSAEHSSWSKHRL